MDRKNSTDVYITDVSPLEDENTCRKAVSLVSAGRREKVGRICRKSERLLSLGAGLLLEYALRIHAPEFSGRDPLTGKNGKPYFESCPVCFSVSHSGNFAACAFSERRIGFDIQKKCEVSEGLARRFFSPDEYGLIVSAVGEAKKNETFFGIWTRKESFVKATGDGMTFPTGSFSVVKNGAFLSSLEKDGKKYYFSEVSSLPGYSVSVCTEGEAPDVNLFEVSLPAILSALTEK